MERRGDGPWWDDDPDLWEHQGTHLTVGELALALLAADPDLPVLVANFDGTGETPLLPPVEIGFTGRGDRPDALVITVTPIAR